MQIINGAIARIILRYGVGLTIGMETGRAVSGDADLVLLIAVGVGVLTECIYAYAKKKGWKT